MCKYLLTQIIFWKRVILSKISPVRKVLGATAYQITRLIAKDYLKLILLAALPAIPAAFRRQGLKSPHMWSADAVLAGGTFVATIFL